MAISRLVRRMKNGDRIHLDGPGTVIYNRKHAGPQLVIEAPPTTKVTHLEAAPPPKDFLKRFRQSGGT